MKRLVLASLFSVIATFCAHACLGCAQRTDNTFYCQGGYTNGGDVCVIKATSCQTYFSCQCIRGCSGCPPEGCPAKLEEPLLKSKRPRLIKCQAKVVEIGPHVEHPRLTGETDDDRLNSFLEMIDRGEFSGPKVTVYIQRDGPIATGIMNKVSTNRWKKIQVGWSHDRKGNPITTWEIVTKSNLAVHIVLIKGEK